MPPTQVELDHALERFSIILDTLKDSILAPLREDISHPFHVLLSDVIILYNCFCARWQQIPTIVGQLADVFLQKHALVLETILCQRAASKKALLASADVVYFILQDQDLTTHKADATLLDAFVKLVIKCPSPEGWRLLLDHIFYFVYQVPDVMSRTLEVAAGACLQQLDHPIPLNLVLAGIWKAHATMLHANPQSDMSIMKRLSNMLLHALLKRHDGEQYIYQLVSAYFAKFKECLETTEQISVLVLHIGLCNVVWIPHLTSMHGSKLHAWAQGNAALFDDNPAATDGIKDAFRVMLKSLDRVTQKSAFKRPKGVLSAHTSNAVAENNTPDEDPETTTNSLFEGHAHSMQSRAPTLPFHTNPTEENPFLNAEQDQSASIVPDDGTMLPDEKDDDDAAYSFQSSPVM